MSKQQRLETTFQQSRIRVEAQTSQKSAATQSTNAQLWKRRADEILSGVELKLQKAAEGKEPYCIVHRPANLEALFGNSVQDELVFKGWHPDSTSAILRQRLGELGYKVKPHAWNVVVAFTDDAYDDDDEEADGHWYVDG